MPNKVPKKQRRPVKDRPQRARPEKDPLQPKRPARRGYRILFEDAQLLVVNKTAGILSVPIAGKISPNVQDQLNAYLAPSKRIAWTVHRIDRYTSGLIVFAKNRKARENMIAQFRAHSPQRFYLALVRGQPRDDEGTLTHKLELTLDGFRQRIVTQGGTAAITHYRVVERMPHAALVEVQLETGLKNQIRVQFAAAGMPLVGDRHYHPREIRDKLRRQALHAWRLSFLHPVSGQELKFEAPVPKDFANALQRLRDGDAGPPDMRPNQRPDQRPRRDARDARKPDRRKPGAQKKSGTRKPSAKPKPRAQSTSGPKPDAKAPSKANQPPRSDTGFTKKSSKRT